MAHYTERLLADVDKRLARLRLEKRPLVYFARGPRGLQSALKGSINVESIERIGARNVAAERMGTGGLVTISPEQLQRHADTALYLAKQTGRNRVMLHRPEASGRKHIHSTR